MWAACTAGKYIFSLYFFQYLQLSHYTYFCFKILACRHWSHETVMAVWRERLEWAWMEGVRPTGEPSGKELLLVDYLNRLDLTSISRRWYSKISGDFLHLFFGVTSLPGQPWGWLSFSSMATLHAGNITVSLLCVALRGRQDPGAACRFPLWAFYGQLEWCTDEKWRSLQAPLFFSDFTLGNHNYYFLKKMSLIWPRLIFAPISMLIWKSRSLFFFMIQK